MMKTKLFLYVTLLAVVLLGVGCMSPEDRTPARCTHLRKIPMHRISDITGAGSYSASSSSDGLVYYCDGWGYTPRHFSDSYSGNYCNGHPHKKYFQCTICEKQGFTLYELRAHFQKMVEVDQDKVLLDPKSWDTHRVEHLKWFSFLRP